MNDTSRVKGEILPVGEKGMEVGKWRRGAILARSRVSVAAARV